MRILNFIKTIQLSITFYTWTGNLNLTVLVFYMLFNFFSLPTPSNPPFLPLLKANLLGIYLSKGF